MSPSCLSDDNTIYYYTPDASFGHHETRCEVCCSQKVLRIPSIVDDYIMGTHGSVNAVECLGIDFHLPNSLVTSTDM